MGGSLQEILKEKGYNVALVQNPTKSLAEDVAFYKVRNRQLEKSGCSLRPLVWRRRDNGSRDTSAGNRPRLHHGVCS